MTEDERRAIIEAAQKLLPFSNEEVGRILQHIGGRELRQWENSQRTIAEIKRNAGVV